MFGKVQETPQSEKTPFTQEVLMEYPSLQLIGRQLITKKVMISLHQMASCLNMAPLRAINLLQRKLLERRLIYPKVTQKL